MSIENKSVWQYIKGPLLGFGLILGGVYVGQEMGLFENISSEVASTRTNIINTL